MSQTAANKQAARSIHPVFAPLRHREITAVILVLAAIAIGLQLRSLSYFADLSNDEASHYISGLAIHDYFLTALGTSPITFIKSYHSHYPLVGIGHWGPFYYFVEALWMLVFSTSLASVLALSAAVTTAVAFGVYRLARLAAGWWASLAIASTFIAAPLVQNGTSQLMLDIPVAFFCFIAMCFYSRYLRDGLVRYSVAFALSASAAMLTKGNGACLALLPPLAVLFHGRLDLVRKFSFWLPLAIVIVLVAPWYALTYRLAATYLYEWGWRYFVTAHLENSASLFDSVGPVILLAAAISVCTTVVRSHKGTASPIQTTACALLLSVWIFQSVVPIAIQDRYLAPLLPPLLLLAADGIALSARWLSQRLRFDAASAEAALALLLALSMVPTAISVRDKVSPGFTVAAPQVWQNLPAQNPAVLIASNGLGEGAAIAALAMYDPNRPSLFAIRGSRLLGGGGYTNQEYVARFETAREITQAIDDYSIPLVLFRANSSDSFSWRHVDQTAQAALLEPNRWQKVLSITSVDPPVVLYAIRGNETKPLEAGRLLALSAPNALRN